MGSELSAEYNTFLAARNLEASEDRMFVCFDACSGL
jgi:hypothetical protein